MIDSVSFRMFGPSSSLNVTGSLQARPPSSDFETRIALSGRPPAAVMPPLAERLIAPHRGLIHPKCSGDSSLRVDLAPLLVSLGVERHRDLPPLLWRQMATIGVERVGRSREATMRSWRGGSGSLYGPILDRRTWRPLGR